jgi:hypothetical protein
MIDHAPETRSRSCASWPHLRDPHDHVAIGDARRRIVAFVNERDGRHRRRGRYGDHAGVVSTQQGRTARLHMTFGPGVLGCRD